MKHKKIILLTSLMLLNATSSNTYVINNNIKLSGNRQTNDAFNVIANQYYRKGKYIQYDQLKMDSLGNKEINRRQVNIKPEDINKNNVVYMDCSSFIYNVYKELYGIDPLNLLLENDGKISSFSTYNLAKLRTETKDGLYSNAVIYGYDYKIRTKYANGKKASTKKTTSKSTIKKELKNLLQPGDLIVLRKEDSGHVMLYTEENDKSYFIHATGTSYDYENMKDKVEGKGSIKKEELSQIFDNKDNSHYIFDKDYVSLTILRPVNIFGNDLSSNTIVRLINKNLDINKTASIDESKTLNIGNKITYTISIKNNAKESQKIVFEDVLPENTELVNGSLNEEFVLAGKKEKIITYTVKTINQNVEIINDDTKVNNQLLNTITHKVGTSLNANKQKILVDVARKFNSNNVEFNKTKEYNKIATTVSNVKLNYNPARFISAIYYNTFNVDLNLLSTKQIENEVFTKLNNALYLNTNSESNISKMVVPNLYGGVKVSNNDPKRIRKVLKNDLIIGDIISYRYIKDGSETGNTYLYLGDNKLLGLTTRKVVNIEADNILEKLNGCTSFVVLRPSLAVELNIDEQILMQEFNETQKQTFTTAVNRYLKRIDNKTIKYNSEKRDLGVSPENCSYLDSSSLIYNIYYNAFNVEIPSTSTSLLNTKNKKLRVGNIDNINDVYMHNLTIGDIIVYKYSTNEGMKGIVSLYIDNDKILKYNTSGSHIVSLGDYKKEALERVITDLKIIRPSQGYKLEAKENDFIDSENIKIDNEITIELNENKKLDYEVMPQNASNKNVSIKNSNEKIVKVSNSNIEGLKVGTATLTLETMDKTGVKVTTKVNVIKKREVKFKYNSYKLLRGHYIYITPETEGIIKTVSTTNHNIVKVSLENKKIKVVGLKDGEADVIVTLTNGNTAKTTIKVSKNDDNKDISFQNDSYKITIGEERTLTLTFKEDVEIDRFDASNSNISFKKTSSNRSVIITGLKTGKTKLTVYTTDGESDSTTINIVNKLAFEKRRNINLYTSVRKKLILNRNVKEIYSNDESIVKINNGLIEGLKEGKTKISVITKDNQIIEYVINVRNKFFNRK